MAPTTPSPGSPSPAATPTAVLSPSPTPAPASTPCPGECPVTSTLPAARLTIRLYKVTDSNDTLQTEYTLNTEIPVGFKVTVDAVAKDRNDKETFGQGEVDFQVSDLNLVRVGGNHEFQRRFTILTPGKVDVIATLDGIDSNVLTLQFRN